MIEKLRKLLESKKESRSKKLELVEKSDNLDELKALQADIRALDGEIADFEAMIANEEANTNERTQVVVGGVPGVVQDMVTRQNINDEGMEYRKAFMAYVTKGTAIPAELRIDAISSTTDIGEAIPVPVLDRILELIEKTGDILPLVTRTYFAPGFSIPKSSVKPTATWVSTEGGSSDKKKHTITGAVTFTHHKLRIEIAATLEASIMSISAFERLIASNIAEAMVKALEDAIINGDANGPDGILDATPKATVEVAEGSALAYAHLVEAEGKLPLAYENGAVWFMTKKSFMGFYGMTVRLPDGDGGLVDTGQPIARVNYGLDGKPERTLLGRKVVLNDYMKDFALSVEADTVFAFLFNPSDYILNTNYQVGIQRKEDWDTENQLTKAVMIADGKVIDAGSLVTLLVKNT